MASRDYKTPPRPPQRSGSPLLIGVFIGLVLGLATALAVAIYVFKMPPPFMPAQPGRPPAEPAAAAPAAARPAPGSPAAAATAAAPASKPAGAQGDCFEFYEILAGRQKKDCPPPAPAGPATSPAEAGFVYYLQAGAFQSAPEADNLKAQLAMLGLEAAILSATHEGRVLHRVRLGPFASVEASRETHEQLRANHLDAALIKERQTNRARQGRAPQSPEAR